MKCAEFKRKLEDCAPSIADLAKLGLQSEDINQLRRPFFIPERSEFQALEGPQGELGELFGKHDPSQIEIGMVRFYSHPERSGANWVVGQVEADPLMVDATSGEVFVEDLTAVERKMLWRVAKDGESLLAALLTAACFLGRCMYDEALAGDKHRRSVCVDRCVAEAGGERYRSFYQMLIGL